MPPSEQDVEYDRLRSVISWRGIESLINQRHGSHTSVDGTPKLRHLYAVYELISKLCKSVYAERDLNLQNYWTKVAGAAALLHEVMSLGGCVYEQVVEVADEATARVVCNCTPDPRLPRPKRLLLYSNQVGLAEEVPQMVKLCDLRHEATIRRRVFEYAERVQAVAMASEWLEEAYAVLPVLDKADAHHTRSLRIMLKEDIALLEQLCKPEPVPEPAPVPSPPTRRKTRGTR